MSAFETEWTRLMAEANVPGMAAAVIRNGQLERTLCRGVRDVQSPVGVDEDTVFDAASLSKPVFAHAVLQLADQGRLSLDAPLVGYLPEYRIAGEHACPITARHVLSHCAGLPNWRTADLPLKTHFMPGKRFSYSGEGYLYLQRAVEAMTGEKLHMLAQRLVLGPLGMTRSSFIWNESFDANRACPHDDYGKPAVSWKPGEANAASTLQTTAADYARFLRCVLDGARLKPATARQWIRPQIEVRHAKPQSLGPETEDVATGVAWGLGWGLEPDEGTFFHWGNNGAFKAFTIGSVHSRDALVFFMNGASGLCLMPEIVSALIQGNRPSLAWLGYGRQDSAARRMLRAACQHGVAAVWQEMSDAALDADDLLWIARGLSAFGLDDDALGLREQIKRAETSIASVTRPH